MKKDEVEVGATYAAKISGKVVPVSVEKAGRGLFTVKD